LEQEEPLVAEEILMDPGNPGGAGNAGTGGVLVIFENTGV
jgi:hypothetical protein